MVEEIKDFRPISLMGSIYKMISKVLAGRLKLVLPKIISCHQSAFIKGRQILDCALLANECMDSTIKSGIPGIIVKIDFEKAFDHVSWGFLDEVLSKMGFGRKWRTWIQGCISNIPISVLINGSPHQQFTTGKGLRQGDPISPFLFLIVSEALHLMFQSSMNLGRLGSFQLGSNGLKIGHLQFADDTLVFLDESREQVDCLRYLLVLFELVSGLRINFAETSMYGVAGDTNLDSLASILGCRHDYLPANYLGLPLGDNALGSIKWDALLEKVKGRLPSWIRSVLNKSGKLTLVKSVLSSIPVYYVLVIYRSGESYK